MSDYSEHERRLRQWADTVRHMPIADAGGDGTVGRYSPGGLMIWAVDEIDRLRAIGVLAPPLTPDEAPASECGFGSAPGRLRNRLWVALMTTVLDSGYAEVDGERLARTLDAALRNHHSRDIDQPAEDLAAVLADLPSRFLAARTARGASLRDVAAETGLTSACLSEFERSVHELPVSKAARIVRWLGSTAAAPEPPVGTVYADPEDGGIHVWTRRAGGWHCSRRDCDHCPCGWSEVANWLGGIDRLTRYLPGELPAYDDRAPF